MNVNLPDRAELERIEHRLRQAEALLLVVVSDATEALEAIRRMLERLADAGK